MSSRNTCLGLLGYVGCGDWIRKADCCVQGDVVVLVEVIVTKVVDCLVKVSGSFLL